MLKPVLWGFVPLLAVAALSLGDGTARGSDCGSSPTPRYLPTGSIPEGLRSPQDPPPEVPPTTPTDPSTPPVPPVTPATPTTPTTPSAPPAPGSPVTPQTPSAPGETSRGEPAERRKPATDETAWEVWWGVHRFEFLKPADHSAERTGEDRGTAYEMTRKVVRPRLLELATASQDYRLRGAAVSAAVRIATPAEADAMGDLVRKSLRSHNLELGMGVGNALSYTSATPLIPAVHPVASDEIVEAHVRGLIALAIPVLWRDAADALLVQLLEKDSGSERAYTEGLLMAFGSTHGAEGTTALERIVRDGAVAPILRATALTALARRSLDARALLIASIDDARVEVRRAAATGLGILPWAVAPPDTATIETLRRAGETESAEALEAMLTRLTSERTDALLDGPIRDACLRLGRILLNEHDRSVRAAAAISLGRIARASNSQSAVRILIADLARTRDLREYDLIALAMSRDPRALRHCLDALKKPGSQATTRAAAAVALGILGSPVAQGPLESMLTDDANPEVRGHAAVALGMLKDTSALRLIRHGFDTAGNVDAVGQFAIALGLFGDVRDGERLTTRLARGGSGLLQFNLAEALRLLGQVGTTKALLAIAENPESDAAPHATRALASILAPNDGGKPERARAFDHIGGEDYIVAYVIEP